jgi:D-3-phosphoglycerate dehydrogenase / 2-oxoglutarate reductase
MRVLITDRFSEEGLACLARAGLDVVDRPGIADGDLSEAIEQVDALLVRSQTRVDQALLEHAVALLAISRAGVGYENIDVEACDRHGIAVMNTPGASAITTAERTVALIMALLHQIPIADRSIRSGKWDRRSYMGREAFGKTLGILGFGNVGRLVADRARGLHLRVLAHDPALPREATFNLGIEPVEFDELLERADIVSCHVSADPRLRGLLGRRELGLLKPGAWFVNTSRGFLVDEAALIDALDQGRLAGAALDVFETEPLPAGSRLRELDSVILSPHLGASTREAEARVSIAAAEQLVDFLRHGRAANLVSRPAALRWRPASSVR